MRHIVIITTSYPLSKDGSESAGSFVEDFAYTLAEKVRITVIAPGSKKAIETNGENLSVHRFRAPLQPLSLLKVQNPFHWFAIIATLINGRKLLREVVEKEAVDHILALWVLPSGFWAKDIGKRYNIPYSTWALGSDIWNLAKIPFVRNVLKGVLQNSHMNFADGFKLKDDVAVLSGRTCEFLPSTRNLHTPQNKKLTESPPYRLAFLGRWHRNKGVDLLIDSLMHLDDADWSQISEVRVCGGGPMIDQIKTGIATLNNYGRPVVCHGYLKKEEAVELLLWADYVLIPSRIESIPVIFSDAMKCRCPVVCMPVGDLPRLVAEYRIGILAEEVSGQAFANAIKHIVEYSPQYFSDRLEQTSKDFNMNHITAMLLKQLIDNGVKDVE